MKKYCQNCGFENNDKNKFCMNCGAKLEDISREQNSLPKEKMNKSNNTKSFSDKTLKVLSGLAIILSIIAIIFSVLYNPSIKLESGSVGQQELANNSVGTDNIVNGAITDEKITNNGISKIADNSIGSNQIISGSISVSDLNNDTLEAITGLNVIENFSITGNKIANNTITSQNIGAGAVGSSEIADESITTDDIADDAISFTNMKIKIKYGVAADRVNGSSISHGLGTIPICVIVTPDYESFGDGNATIFANVYNIGSSSFRVGLWYEDITNSGQIYPVTSANSVDIYWLAIYTA